MPEEIPHGDKMIAFKVRFWTTNLTNKKMAWNKGAITVVTNRSRGLRNTPENHVFFRSIEELPGAIREILKKNDIALVSEEKGSKKKYLIDL